MTEEDFRKWLTAYGAAWNARDTDAYLRLFTETAEYHWTPFEAPECGHAQISEAFKRVLSRQESPAFSATVITLDRKTGWAEWSCRFTRSGTGDPVRVEGILKVVFDEDKCREFRKWWHALEPGQGDLMRDFDA